MALFVSEEIARNALNDMFCEGETSGAADVTRDRPYSHAKIEALIDKWVERFKEKA